MATDLALEIENIQDQLGKLTTSFGDSPSLEEGLLSACSHLLDILYRLQSTPAEHSAEHQPSEAGAIGKAVEALQKSQKALYEIRSRFNAIVESDSLYVCRMQPDGMITFVNHSLARYLNISPETIYQHNFFKHLNETDARDLLSTISAQDQAAKEFTRTYSIRSSNGDMGWQQWNFRLFHDSRGQLIEIQAVGHDVTGIKQAELTADRRNRELSALHTATRALLITLDTENLLGQILDAAMGALPMAQKGTLHLIARDTGQLELRASIGYADPRIKKFSYSESSGYVARAVRERRPLLFHEAKDEIPSPRGDLIPEMNTIRSAIVAPLILQDRILGAISLESAVPSAFNESDLHLLVSFAATATNAIQNAELHAEVQKLAITDALTGLYNRRGLFELGEREIERSFRFKRPLTAILLDVDRLKDINDRYGHFAGDQVLRTIATHCSKHLRKVDILGRYGGDEFVILLPETHLRLGSMVGERLRHSVQDAHIPVENALLKVSISLGIAGLTTDDTNLESLINRADAAMYAAKENGRNRTMPVEPGF